MNIFKLNLSKLMKRTTIAVATVIATTTIYNSSERAVAYYSAPSSLIGIWKITTHTQYGNYPTTTEELHLNPNGSYFVIQTNFASPQASGSNCQLTDTAVVRGTFAVYGNTLTFFHQTRSFNRQKVCAGQIINPTAITNYNESNQKEIAQFSIQNNGQALCMSSNNTSGSCALYRKYR